MCCNAINFIAYIPGPNLIIGGSRMIISGIVAVISGIALSVLAAFGEKSKDPTYELFNDILIWSTTQFTQGSIEFIPFLKLFLKCYQS